MQQARLWNKNYVLVFISIIFIFSNFYALTACMPLALKELYGYGTKEISLIASAYFFGIVILRPFSGLIGDRFGKKKVSFLFFAAFTACTIFYLGVECLYILLAVRLLHGMAHSISTTSHAALAIDFTPSSMKGQGIGYYGLAMCLAMVIAPALGTFIQDEFGYKTLLQATILMGVAGTVIMYFVREQAPKEVVKPSFDWRKLIEKAAVPIGISVFLLSFTYSGIMSFIAVYLKELAVENGTIYFYLAFALTMIVTRPYVGKIIDSKGAHTMVGGALLLFAAGMVGISIASNLLTVLLAGTILGLSYGAVFPSLQTITVQSCPPQNSGTAMGTFYLFYDFGLGVGVLVFGMVAAAFGYAAMYQIIGVIVVLTYVLYTVLKKKSLY